MRPDELLTLEQRISAERFTPVRAATGDDIARALRRYERNTEISAAFWAVLSDLEIVVRERDTRAALFVVAGRLRQARLVRQPGANLHTPDRQRHRGRSAARGRVRAGAPGRIVAELPFGFWRFLLSSRYERTLWLPCLRDTFPGIRGRGMRRDVHDADARSAPAA